MDAKQKFLNSVPPYITEEFDKDEKQSDNITDTSNLKFIEKLTQIKNAIIDELELYEYLKQVKKEKNHNKRLPMKK